MKDPKFKVGDIVTYKYKKSLSDGIYHWGGPCLGGFGGKITMIIDFIPDKDCYGILVTCDERENTFTMLESEFEEYDIPKLNKIPEKWHINIQTKEQAKIIGKWIDNSEYAYEPNKTDYEKCEQLGIWGPVAPGNVYHNKVGVKITFEQFKEYFLKKEKELIKKYFLKVERIVEQIQVKNGILSQIVEKEPKKSLFKF